jgi:hypothetical protein
MGPVRDDAKIHLPCSSASSNDCHELDYIGILLLFMQTGLPSVSDVLPEWRSGPSPCAAAAKMHWLIADA